MYYIFFFTFLVGFIPSMLGFSVLVFYIGIRSNLAMFLLADFEGNVIKEGLNQAFSVLSIQALIFVTFLSHKL